ncbi:hypothetical protein [uncultured Pseudomonas sp.]|uniref:hypothetical protein n=1 Tax=uncultured Pseudomonas sp. TaxID=114707 RepID=UPI0025DC5818|nr:hypothetical protein [uncultured Pseudomonas sp.]
MSAKAQRFASELVSSTHREAALLQMEDFIEQLRFATDPKMIHGYAMAALAAAGTLHILGIIDQARYDQAVHAVEFAQGITRAPVIPIR